MKIHPSIVLANVNYAWATFDGSNQSDTTDVCLLCVCVCGSGKRQFPARPFGRIWTRSGRTRNRIRSVSIPWICIARCAAGKNLLNTIMPFNYIFMLMGWLSPVFSPFPLVCPSVAAIRCFLPIFACLLFTLYCAFHIRTECTSQRLTHVGKKTTTTILTIIYAFQL